MTKLMYYGLSPSLLSYSIKSLHKKKLKTLSNTLRQACCSHQFISLSSLQINESIQYFVMLNKQYIKQNEWRLPYKPKPSYYRGFLNAEIKNHSNLKIHNWEQCASYPGIRMLVQRSSEIKVWWLNEELKEFKEQFQGFQATVLQHQIDHHFGYDYIRKTSKIQIINESLREKYQEQCNLLVQNYLKSIKQSPQNKNPQKDSQLYVNNPHYNRLKQFLTYSIIDPQKNT